MKKFVLLAMATVLLLSSCPVLSLLGIGGDDTQTQDQVELRLNLNGGTGTAATVMKFNPGQIATTPPRPTGWTYTGHQFIGWNTAANGLGDGFQPGDPITMLSSITLYVQWRALGHPYSISELESRLNGLTARLLVFEEDYDITSALGADGPPEQTLAFGYADIANRTLAGNLWKYEGWIDDPDPDDPDMLPWQPTAGINYDVYILVEFDQSAPELVVGAGSSIATYTINPLATFNVTTSWNLAATSEVYLKMDQGHSYNVTGFAAEWNGEQAMLMVFPGDLDLAETLSSGDDPTLAALGFGTITGNSLTGGLYQAPPWNEMEDPQDMDLRPWFPAIGEEYQVLVMIDGWFMVFFGEGTDLEPTPMVVNALASGLTRTTGLWTASLSGSVGIDMENDSGQKYKVSGFDSLYTDQTAIMLVMESPVDWPTVMSSETEGPPAGILAFGWRWIDENGTVYGGLYDFLETPEVWDAVDTGNRNDDLWAPWYPDPAKNYELVMILPEAGLVFFGDGTYLPYGEDDPNPMEINPLALRAGSEPRWRLSAIGAVTFDMGGGDDGGGDQEPLVLTGVSGLYTESRTIAGTPYFSNENGLLDLNYTDHAVVEGTKAMQVTYELPNWDTESFPWLHMGFGRPCDITAVDYFVFSLDKSDLTDLHTLDIIFWSGVDGSINSTVNLHEYAPSTLVAPYDTYRIPLEDLVLLGLDRGDFHNIAIGGPRTSDWQALAGTVYFDDIYFE